MAILIDRHSSQLGILGLLLAGLLVPAAAASQQAIVPLQFSFSDPGARSMGFGGAFVALADDATAAYSNPAGLVQLVKPEVSIEGRNWSYSTPFTEGGRVEGLPSGFGIDTTVGVRRSTSDVGVTGLSFLSVAYPKGKWTLAFFRHQLANLEFSGETQGLFAGGTNCCQIRLLDQRFATDWDIVSYGVSGAYRIHEKFNIGLGLVYHDAMFTSIATQFLPDDDSLESIFGPNSYLPENSFVTQHSSIDDTDFGLIGGFLWILPKGWQIGGVYRQGPELDAGLEFVAGEAGDFGVPPGEVITRSSLGDLRLPPALGLGFAYRAPNGQVTLSFQWDRIEYSRIVESVEEEDVTVDDADEFHLGGEYVFLQTTPIIAVRAGLWFDPDHQARAISDDPVTRALQQPGDDEIHYAAGLGLAFKRFQVDLGVDFADRVKTISISAIYSF